MVGDKRADRAIGMGDSILMIMECESRYEEKEANEQEINKSFNHRPIETGLFFIIP